MVFDNVNADRVKRYRSLQQSSARKRNGLFLIEGPNSVFSALATSPEKIETLYLTPEAAERHTHITGLLESFNERGLKPFGKPIAQLTLATDEVISTISENAQGVLAVGRTPEFGFGKQFETADQIVDLALTHYDNNGVASGPFLIAILNNVRDPGNAGTVIRTADAMGADLVVLTGDSVEITNPKVIRSSAGSVFHGANVVPFKDLPALVAALKSRNWQVYAATGGRWPCKNIYDDDLNLELPTAWIFGNEAWGLTDDDAALADEKVSIPIYGNAESLNLAIAAAICLFASSSAQRRNGAHQE